MENAAIQEAISDKISQIKCVLNAMTTPTLPQHLYQVSNHLCLNPGNRHREGWNILHCGTLEHLVHWNIWIQHCPYVSWLVCY